MMAGAPVRLSSANCEHPKASPDNQFVACLLSGPDSPTGSGAYSLAIFPFQGGEPRALYPLGHSTPFHSGIQWSSDGTSILYVKNQDGIARIWRQPVSGEPAQPLDIAAASQIFHFQPPFDGEWIVSSGRKSTDVVMIHR